MRSLAILLLAVLPLPLLVGAAQAPLAQDDAAKPAAQADDEGKWKGEPYLLTTCAASGRPIDVKGTPTTMVIEGRELKFCCGGCGKAVAKDPAKWLEKVDQALAEQQRSIYPTRTCVVSGEPLFSDDGEDAATEVVIQNRLFRVCCGGCAKKVAKDPGKYAALLDEQAKAAQAKAYPLADCVVNKGEALGEKAKEIMVAGRLVKVCCGGCVKKVTKDPYAYVMAVDAAWAKATAEKAEKADKAKKAGAGVGLGKGL